MRNKVELDFLPLAPDPQKGVEIGAQIAKGVDTVVSALGEVSDFLDIHIAPADCNGVVLQARRKMNLVAAPL